MSSACGDFAENYVQEAPAKTGELAALRPQPQWHPIGPLQNNKTRVVAEAFDWPHKVDRLKIAQHLAEQQPAGLPPVMLCMQVNVSGEANNGGALPAKLSVLARAVAALPPVCLPLRGLMSISEAATDLEAQRHPHRQLRALFDGLRSARLALYTLSMGISAELAAAVAKGVTIVHVGSAIFGRRS